MSAKKVMASQEKVFHLPKILHDYIVMASQEKVLLILTLILTDDNDERLESYGQSGEGLRPNSSKAPKILHDYRLLFCMIYSNANDRTDDVSLSQVSCWRKKWIEIPNTTLRQFKWVRSTQDSQVVVRCSTNIIMILGSQENEQE